MRALPDSHRPIVPKQIHLPIPRPEPNIVPPPALVTPQVEAATTQASSIHPSIVADAAKQNDGTGQIVSGMVVKQGSARGHLPSAAAPIPLARATTPATASLNPGTGSARQHQCTGGKRSEPTSDNTNDKPSKRQRRPLLDITTINNNRRQANRRVIRPTEKLREQ